MALSEVKKIFLIAELSQKETFLEEIQNLGIVEIKESGPEASPSLKIKEIEKKLSRLERVLSFLEETEPKNFWASLTGEKPEIGLKDFAQIINHFDWEQFSEKVEKISTGLGKNKEKEAALKDELGRLTPWKNLGVNLDLLKSSGLAGFKLFIISSRYLNKFQKNLGKIKLAVSAMVEKSSSKIFGFLAFSPGEKEKVEKLLTEAEAIFPVLPELKTTPAGAIQGVLNELKKNKDESRSLKKVLFEMSGQIIQLKVYADFLLQEKIKLEAEKKLSGTRHTFILEGWVEAAKIELLKKELEKLTLAFELVEAPLLKIESAPVILKNKKVFRPFEIITRMFGAPSPAEMDPTPVVAVFFVIFFGICLGDAGYGIILMLLAIWLFKKIKLPAGGRDLLRILFYGGLSSFAAGALMGSWFGLDFETVWLPALLKNALSRVKVIDIFKNPLAMLYFSFFLGLVQIFAGLGLALYNSLKNKDFKTAILDKVSWICFLGGLVIYGLSKAGVLFWTSEAGYFTLFWALFLILTQGRHQKNIFARLGSGILSLYKTSGYLGDMLSYSRLLALGMCSAVIAMVINILAGLAKNSLPVLGIFLMVFIFLAGHLFNLLISILSAFIHSMRLQLVEFFGKFYQDGGRFLKPFQKETKYLKIIKEGDLWN